MCSLLGGLLVSLLVLAGTHAVGMILAQVFVHLPSTARDKPILWAAQPHVVVLSHVVVEGDVICVPKSAYGADVHANDFGPSVGTVMGTPCEGPL